MLLALGIISLWVRLLRRYTSWEETAGWAPPRVSHASEKCTLVSRSIPCSMLRATECRAVTLIGIQARSFSAARKYSILSSVKKTHIIVQRISISTNLQT